jgi:hypothetical protein
MRGFLVAAVAAVGLLLASFASAQGLGDVATQEKEKRKTAPGSDSKVYTESDLGQSVAPVGAPSLPVSAEEASSEEGEEAAGDETGESEEDQRAKAEAAWRGKLDRARQEEDVYRDLIDRLQLELNDLSGGVNTPSRAAKIAFLDENKQLLAETQQRVGALEAEGRANNYR